MKPLKNAHTWFWLPVRWHTRMGCWLSLFKSTIEKLKVRRKHKFEKLTKMAWTFWGVKCVANSCGGVGSGWRAYCREEGSLWRTVQVQWDNRLEESFSVPVFLLPYTWLGSLVDVSFNTEISYFSPVLWCQGLWGNIRAVQSPFRSEEFTVIDEE